VPGCTKQTDHFTGREWVFQALNDWLAKPDGSRCFLLTGKPGSGKTAFAARLAQFSQGIVSPPDDFNCLNPNFLSAIHFCSARDRHWINPTTFAESLALQLSSRYQVFAEALAEKRGDQRISIEVIQHAASITGGQMTGILINKLDMSGILPEDAFNCGVREPMEVLLDKEPDKQVVVMVDALDEALLYTGKVDIVSLLAQADNMSRNVRFILTSRKVERVEHAFRKATGIFLSSKRYDVQNQEDIGHYVEGRLHHEESLVWLTAKFKAG